MQRSGLPEINFRQPRPIADSPTTIRRSQAVRTSIRVHGSSFSIAAVVIAVFLGVPHPAQSQQAETKQAESSKQAESTKVMLDIGNADGPPGRTLPLPLNLAV